MTLGFESWVLLCWVLLSFLRVFGSMGRSTGSTTGINKSCCTGSGKVFHTVDASEIPRPTTVRLVSKNPWQIYGINLLLINWFSRRISEGINSTSSLLPLGRSHTRATQGRSQIRISLVQSFLEHCKAVFSNFSS